MENSNRESGFMCRLVRFALWGTAALLFFAVLLVATLPLWISPIATGIAGKVVPGYTGTDFRIDRFCLNPYSGSLVISGVKLSNPEGFGDAAAFSLSGLMWRCLSGLSSPIQSLYGRWRLKMPL